ncbi:hypothetical protein GCM10027278_29410 [Paralcaligenes ginsengisoli]
MALLPLLALVFNFSLSADAYGSTHTTVQNSKHHVSAKKTSAHHSSKKTSAKKSKAHVKTSSKRHASAHKARITHRASLRTRHHIASAAHTRRVAFQEENHDAITHRSQRGLEPLTPHAALRSEVAYVQDLENSTVLYDKNSDEVRPIASISKLMTALIVSESGQSMSDMLTITEDDVDHLRHSRSRLTVGSTLSRADMLHLALMSSENRAAHALARNYPGGIPAFVRAMNDKARAMGMRKTHFIEPTGLSSDNVSTPRDLVKLLVAASKQPLIHRYTTDDHYEVAVAHGRRLIYNNTNGLVRNPNWNIQISKTGFINESGECLVMLTRIDRREVAIILLNSTGRYSRIGDAMRIRNLVERETNIAML